MIKKLAVFGLLATALAAGSCEPAADVASRNISKAADNFEVMRKIVFYNGITGEYVAVVEGLCSLGNNDDPGKLTVTCKTGPSKFTKNFLGLSDNVTYFAMQVNDVDVSTYHNRVIWRPQTILPDLNLQVDGNELMNDRY